MKILYRLLWYPKMVLVSIWFFVITLVFYVATFFFYGHKKLSWAYARALSKGAQICLMIKVKVRGRENLRFSPMVLIINHQSNFDPFLMGTMFPKNTVIIGKHQLQSVPLFGRLFAASNNIMIDRTDRKESVAGLSKAVEAMKTHGSNIWIFPEGTRSKGRGLGRFKKGAFYMAVEAQVPIIPVVCKPMERVLDMQRKLARGGVHEIRILPPIPTRGKTVDDIPALVAKAEDLFAKEIAAMMGIRPEDVWAGPAPAA